MLESVSDPRTKHDAHAWFLLIKKKKAIIAFSLFYWLPFYQDSDKCSLYISNSLILDNKYTSNACARMWELKTQ